MGSMYYKFSHDADADDDDDDDDGQVGTEQTDRQTERQMNDCKC